MRSYRAVPCPRTVGRKVPRPEPPSPRRDYEVPDRSRPASCCAGRASKSLRDCPCQFSDATAELATARRAAGLHTRPYANAQRTPAMRPTASASSCCTTVRSADQGPRRPGATRAHPPPLALLHDGRVKVELALGVVASSTTSARRSPRATPELEAAGDPISRARQPERLTAEAARVSRGGAGELPSAAITQHDPGRGRAPREPRRMRDALRPPSRGVAQGRRTIAMIAAPSSSGPASTLTSDAPSPSATRPRDPGMPSATRGSRSAPASVSVMPITSDPTRWRRAACR